MLKTGTVIAPADAGVMYGQGNEAMSEKSLEGEIGTPAKEFASSRVLVDIQLWDRFEKGELISKKDVLCGCPC